MYSISHLMDYIYKRVMFLEQDTAIEYKTETVKIFTTTGEHDPNAWLEVYTLKSNTGDFIALEQFKESLIERLISSNIIDNAEVPSIVSQGEFLYYYYNKGCQITISIIEDTLIVTALCNSIDWDKKNEL